MEVSGLEANKPIPLLGLEIISKQDIKEWNGNRVCSCIATDASGECILSLWNDEIDRFEEGDFIVIRNGWCKEYNGIMQVSSGKFGRIELIKRPKKIKDDGGSSKSIEYMRLNWYLRPTISKIRFR